MYAFYVDVLPRQWQEAASCCIGLSRTSRGDWPDLVQIVWSYPGRSAYGERTAVWCLRRVNQGQETTNPRHTLGEATTNPPINAPAKRPSRSCTLHLMMMAERHQGGLTSGRQPRLLRWWLQPVSTNGSDSSG